MYITTLKIATITAKYHTVRIEQSRKKTLFTQVEDLASCKLYYLAQSRILFLEHKIPPPPYFIIVRGVFFFFLFICLFQIKLWFSLPRRVRKGVMIGSRRNRAPLQGLKIGLVENYFGVSLLKALLLSNFQIINILFFFN